MLEYIENKSFKIIDSFLISSEKNISNAFYVIILSFLFIIYFFPSSITGNEEYFYQLSHKRVLPDIFSNNNSVFDQSNARFIPELFLGTLIKQFGYETSHIIARTIMAILYAFSFSILFRALKISFLVAVITVGLFYVTGQHLIGQDWLLKGIETKTLAYAFVISALGFSFHKRFYLAIGLVVVATYFHFLVGGFWALAVFLLCWSQTKNIKQNTALWLIYILSVLPLVIILFVDQYGGANIDTQNLNIDFIYAERSAHHVAPFISETNFYRLWLPGILVIIFLIPVLFSIRKNYSDKLQIDFLLILLTYLIIALIISYFDREKMYFAKLFMFRPSSLIWLLTIAILLKALNEHMTDEAKKVWLSLVLLLIPLTLMPVVKKKANELLISSNATLTKKINKLVTLHSKPNEIMLIDPTAELETVSFQRKIKRPIFVMKKFVPSHPTDIAKWKKRLNFRQEIFKNGCTKRMKYPVKILFTTISNFDSVKNCGSVIWRSKKFFLIKVSASY